MVFHRERDNERPPLSRILPHLYLGAESDVTQDCLSARGISFVLSVSRCSPQPTFLPRSQYLRVPIDDSHRDDLLPWIPEALRFIDGAMSSGGSVLVHCAAGISRSPALAVAYIMYSLGMDLDHAYRFVKERRPSISPNFNFLGQLQHFQVTLSQKASDGKPVIRPIKSPDASLQSANENINRCSTGSLSTNQSVNHQDNCVTDDFTGVEKVCGENSYHGADNAEPRYSHSGETGKTSTSSGNEQRNPSQLKLSLSGKLRTLTLALNQNQREGQAPSEAATPSPREPVTPVPKPTHLPIPPGYASLSERPVPKPTQLPIPPGYASLSERPVPKPTQLPIPPGYTSLSERRKSLTLSLSPLGSISPTGPLSNYKNGAATQQHSTANSKSVHRRETGAECEAKRPSNKPSVDVNDSSRAEGKQREMSSSRTKAARPSHGSSQSRARGEREGRARGKTNASCPHSAGENETGRDRSRGKAARRRSCSKSRRCTVVDQQPAPESKLAVSAVEADESLAEDRGALSPLNLTVNKLLGWGERVLLGVLLGPRIKEGRAALPYRC